MPIVQLIIQNQSFFRHLQIVLIKGGPTLRVASEPSVYKPLARAVTATMWPENSPARELAVSLISLITVFT